MSRATALTAALKRVVAGDDHLSDKERAARLRASELREQVREEERMYKPILVLKRITGTGAGVGVLSHCSDTHNDPYTFEMLHTGTMVMPFLDILHPLRRDLTSD